jgi:hypothetical protein
MTQKSESVREAEQRQYPGLARPVAACYTQFRADREIKPGVFLSFEQWLDFAEVYAEKIAKSTTLKLAEEAERNWVEAEPSELGDITWHDAAAWLREKAR